MKKDAKKKVTTTKKYKSTYDEYVDSLSPKRRKEFEEGFRDLALSELILALMEDDEVSVRKLAEMADVSPTVVQAMRLPTGNKKDFNVTSLFKVLKALGINELYGKRNGHLVPLDFYNIK